MVALLFTCGRVIALDVDSESLGMARHNARVYEVAHRMDFLCADIYAQLPHLHADVLFMAPPWGGPEYLDKEVRIFLAGASLLLSFSTSSFYLLNTLSFGLWDR